MVFPYKWYINPFAVSGDLTTVPNGVQPDGSISYAQGWGPNYALDPSTNPSALNVDRRTTNELFYDITQWAQYVQSGLPAYWIDNTTNGGSAFQYGIGARVLYTDGFIYESNVANNTQTPGFGVSNWARTRTKISANTTFYVNASTGNDSNSGLSSGAAWLTLQHAYDVLSRCYDFNGSTITLDIEGAFTAPLVMDRVWPGNGASASPNFIISTTSGASISTTASCISAAQGVNVAIQGAITLASSAGSAIVSSGRANVNVGAGLIFSTCGAAHMLADSGNISIVGNYTVSGNANTHYSLGHGGIIGFSSGITITASGTRTFSTFAFCQQCSILDAASGSNPTFSGSFLGVRYSVIANAAIVGTGGVTTVFPGSSSGTTASGGQYL